MENRKIINGLRAMLSNQNITQDEYELICAAIRALGGNP